MKKTFMAMILMTFILVGCGSKPEISDYINVNVTGMDTKGVMTYDIDFHGLAVDALKLKVESIDDLSLEKMKDYLAFLDAIKIDVNETVNLKNEDEVIFTFTISDSFSKKVKTSNYTHTVSGLKAGTVISEQELKDNTIVEVSGVDGEGIIEVDNIFKDNTLARMEFDTKGLTNLSNGDKVLIKVADSSFLSNAFYVLNEKDGFEVEISNLPAVAKEASQIKNLSELTKLIEEEIKDKFDDSYELKGAYYREHAPENAVYGSYSEGYENRCPGAYFYLIEYTTTYSDREIVNHYVYGADNLILDENNNVNLSFVKRLYRDKQKSSYSLESIIKLLENDGFIAVK